MPHHTNYYSQTLSYYYFRLQISTIWHTPPLPPPPPHPTSPSPTINCCEIFAGGSVPGYNSAKAKRCTRLTSFGATSVGLIPKRRSFQTHRQRLPPDPALESTGKEKIAVSEEDAETLNGVRIEGIKDNMWGSQEVELVAKQSAKQLQQQVFDWQCRIIRFTTVEHFLNSFSTTDICSLVYRQSSIPPPSSSPPPPPPPLLLSTAAKSSRVDQWLGTIQPERNDARDKLHLDLFPRDSHLKPTDSFSWSGSGLESTGKEKTVLTEEEWGTLSRVRIEDSKDKMGHSQEGDTESSSSQHNKQNCFRRQISAIWYTTPHPPPSHRPTSLLPLPRPPRWPSG